MIAVGFTGSRGGLTSAQGDALAVVLSNMLLKEGARQLHHGDCIGSDASAARIARNLGYRTVAHPPANPRLRAHAPADDVRKPLPYKERDRAIVAVTLALIACPATDYEVLRSGTWYTVRRAREAGRRLIVIGPTGVVVEQAHQDVPLRVLAAEQRRELHGLLAASSLGCPTGRCGHLGSQHEAEDHDAAGEPVRPICCGDGGTCPCGDEWRLTLPDLDAAPDGGPR